MRSVRTERSDATNGAIGRYSEALLALIEDLLRRPQVFRDGDVKLETHDSRPGRLEAGGRGCRSLRQAFPPTWGSNKRFGRFWRIWRNKRSGDGTS